MGSFCYKIFFNINFFIIQLYWYINSIHQNILFDLKVYFFLPILKEISTFSWVSKSCGPQAGTVYSAPDRWVSQLCGPKPHLAPVCPGREHSLPLGSSKRFSSRERPCDHPCSSPHSYSESIQFDPKVTAQKQGN